LLLAGDPKAPNRFRAVYELSDFYWRAAGTRASDALLSALGDPDHNTRERAADALGKIGEARAVEPLIALLHDPRWAVRKHAAWALGLIADVRAIDPLLAAIENDEASWVRVHAAMALGHIGDARAVPGLVKAMSDDDANVRSSAAGSLGELGWKPKDEVERLRLLVAAGKLDDAAKIAQTVVPAETNKGRGEGRLEFDKPILVRLQVSAEALIVTEWIEFIRTGGSAGAKLHVEYLSGPKARWRVTIDLLDDSGRQVGRAEASFETADHCGNCRERQGRSAVRFRQRGPSCPGHSLCSEPE